ncbi:hypothetical protein [Shewanella algae]|uniref:hypothetical protein n=1 Tax=Shewanella algae TaxID=38313 RepID=UPI0031F4E7C7
MCILIRQMDLVIRAIECNASADDKETAISLMAAIVKNGCEGCELKTAIPVATACAPQVVRHSPTQ